MMGGTMRAPLTGTFFAVEPTGDVSVVVPLLAATVTTCAVPVLLLRRSMLTEKIARRGQHITGEYGIDPFEFTRVRDIMISQIDIGDVARQIMLGKHLGEVALGVRQVLARERDDFLVAQIVDADLVEAAKGSPREI